VEDDKRKRLSAIQELADSIYSVGPLRGAAVKPFGSFLSNLYAKSGDLDVSVDLRNGSRLPISKKKKQNALRELMKALQMRGVARCMEFIPTARVPILKYMSNHFGISCDVSVNNYPGQIKSRILYWIGTIDERFGDMVLLVKEWAKARNINDPKNGTLNSYSLCLLVIFHFQTCEPAILPPLKDVFDVKAAEELVLYDENNVDALCLANIERFLRQNAGHKNQSSLSHVLESFFHKFFSIQKLSNKVVSTYTGRLEKIQDNTSWMAKSYSLFVEDPFERPDNASRAVRAEELKRIEWAFNHVNYNFTARALNRDELLSLLCTPPVQSIIAKRPPNCQSTVAARLYDDQHHLQARGSTGSISSSQGHATGRQMAHTDQYLKQPQPYNAERMKAGQYQSINRPQVNTTGLEIAVPVQYHSHTTSLQRAGRRTVSQYQNQQRRMEYSPYQRSGTTRYDPAGRRWSHNGSTWDSASQASTSNTSWQR